MLKSECDKIHNNLTSLLYNVSEIDRIEYIWNTDYAIYRIFDINDLFCSKITITQKYKDIMVEYDFYNKIIGPNLRQGIKDVVNQVVNYNSHLRKRGVDLNNKDKGIN